MHGERHGEAAAFAGQSIVMYTLMQWLFSCTRFTGCHTLQLNCRGTYVQAVLKNRISTAAAGKKTTEAMKSYQRPPDNCTKNTDA